MSHHNKVLIAGATGVTGLASVRRFVELGWDVVGCARRLRQDIVGADMISLDLADRERCRTVFGEMTDITHVVYAALVEAPGLVSGWRDRDLMQRNLDMFRNVIDVVVAQAPRLHHISLLQGTKAYGVHLAKVPMPVRERSPRHPHDNFYFLQEDHLRGLQAGANWAWTILRPQVIYGESIGSPMNLVPAIGAYGAIRKEMGLPLSFPGGVSRVSEAVDATLLARALAWAATAPTARNEIFNVTNGDVFVWRNVWPAIADALGMDPGPDEPQQLGVEMPRRQKEWERTVDRHRLRSPRALHEFVGESFSYADQLFGYGVETPTEPVLASTIKIRQAGFHDCVDTEDMFRAAFRRMQEQRLLPATTR